MGNNQHFRQRQSHIQPFFLLRLRRVLHMVLHAVGPVRSGHQRVVTRGQTGTQRGRGQAQRAGARGENLGVPYVAIFPQNSNISATLRPTCPRGHFRNFKAYSATFPRINPPLEHTEPPAQRRREGQGYSYRPLVRHTNAYRVPGNM